MARIRVHLPTDRNYTGTLRLEDDTGRVLLGPFPVCGRANNLAASEHGNPNRSPLLRYGDTPLGLYTVAGVLKTGRGTLYDAEQYGHSGAVVLEPKSGEAALGEANGRFVLFIQGGASGSHNRLRATNGSLRLSDSDLGELIEALRGRTEVVCQCDEALHFGTSLLVTIDPDYDEGDPPPEEPEGLPPGVTSVPPAPRLDTIDPVSRGNLVVLTSGGLANRLKPVVSGMRIAHASRRGFYMHWNTSQGVSTWEERNPRASPHDSENRPIPFPGDWSDFFHFPVARSFHSMCVGRAIERGDAALPRNSTGTYISRYVCRFLRFDDEPMMDYLVYDRLTPSQQRVMSELLAYFRRIQLQSRLDRIVADVAASAGVDRGWVGIHIRRHHPDCRQVPVRSFIAAVDRALRHATRAFLATDSTEIEDMFLSRYGGDVILYSKRSRHRDEQIGIEDALIDLFLLARTGHLIGTAGSSYSDLAWWLGECKASNEYVR
jgi:hypothetical protein